MELNQLVATAIEALEDVKARDIKIFNTEKLTDQFERVIIASGSSNRQTRALAYAVSSAVKEAGGEVLGIGYRRMGPRRPWNGGCSRAPAQCPRLLQPRGNLGRQGSLP